VRLPSREKDDDGLALHKLMCLQAFEAGKPFECIFANNGDQIGFKIPETNKRCELVRQVDCNSTYHSTLEGLLVQPLGTST
jgi:hypothetical protein